MVIMIALVLLLLPSLPQHLQVATSMTVPTCSGAVGVGVTGRREGTEK